MAAEDVREGSRPDGDRGADAEAIDRVAGDRQGQQRTGGGEDARRADGDEPGAHEADEAPPEAIRQPAADDLPGDVGVALESEHRGSETDIDALGDGVARRHLEDALVDAADGHRSQQQDQEAASSDGPAQRMWSRATAGRQRLQ